MLKLGRNLKPLAVSVMVGAAVLAGFIFWQSRQDLPPSADSSAAQKPADAQQSLEEAQGLLEGVDPEEELNDLDSLGN